MALWSNRMWTRSGTGGPATRRRIGSGRRAAARRRATSRPNRRRTCTSTRCGRTGSGCWPGARRACPGRVRRSRSHGRNRTSASLPCGRRSWRRWCRWRTSTTRPGCSGSGCSAPCWWCCSSSAWFAPNRQGYALTLRDLWAQACSGHPPAQARTRLAVLDARCPLQGP